MGVDNDSKDEQSKSKKELSIRTYNWVESGCFQFIKIYDITLDFIQFLKVEILSKYDKYILSADLVIYIFTRCINLYGKYEISFKMANSF